MRRRTSGDSDKSPVFVGFFACDVVSSNSFLRGS
jgi:hypothetical protein